MKTNIFLLCLSTFIFTACKKNNQSSISISEKKTVLQNRHLTSYQSNSSKNIIVVFESGLGDGASVWSESKILQPLLPFADIITYDRAGYGKSQPDTTLRTINKLANELDSILFTLAPGKKIILVGHSLGGMVIRDYAIKHPAKIKGILFVDPAHEDYNNPTQEQEDFIYNLFKSSYGAGFGGALEAKELKENAAYMHALPPLPGVPTVVLTSMKITPQNNAADRELWFKAHDKLKTGVTDFKHITTVNSGHYIQTDEPLLVIDNIKVLINK